MMDTSSNTGNAKYSDRILRKALGQQVGGPERVQRADTSVGIHQRRSRERHPKWRSYKAAQHRVPQVLEVSPGQRLWLFRRGER